jgi:hypothetical protein
VVRVHPAVPDNPLHHLTITRRGIFANLCGPAQRFHTGPKIFYVDNNLFYSRSPLRL